jgi:protein involved in polysaccharide export with SLBB domain
VIARAAIFRYHSHMNFKGMLLVGLLAWFGSAVGMSQIVAVESVPLTISRVPPEELARIEAERPFRVTIMGVPAEDKAKIDGDYPVTKDWTIKLPYVGKINAEGKTTEQLARDIEKAYLDSKIFMEPAVEVFIGKIGDPGDPVIHIGGQVRRPGPIDFAEGMTLWKAIQAAGGATEFGSLKRVKLYRDGKQIVYDMEQKENLTVPLKVNDTIEVPQRNFYSR